jgi:hypothetical protein
MESGGECLMEPIEKVIERCRDRIDRSLDCNVADVLRLIEVVEMQKQEKRQVLPLWAGLGTGD